MNLGINIDTCHVENNFTVIAFSVVLYLVGITSPCDQRLQNSSYTGSRFVANKSPKVSGSKTCARPDACPTLGLKDTTDPRASISGFQCNRRGGEYWMRWTH